MRINNSIRNTYVAIVGQVLVTVVSFISRTVFIKVLGAEYLGVSGLFSNIISVLSLAELGIGSAITYSMYKPLSEGDRVKIKALMGLYSNIYRNIGIFIAIIGMALIPFFDLIIKDKPNVSHLNIIYILILANTVISYFFSYKRAIIGADQKGYINTVNYSMFLVIQYFFQIIILLLTNNFLLYLSASIVFTYLSNIAISKKVDKIYPYLANGNREYLDKESKKTIFKNMLAMISHKIGGVLVLSTDNILISAYVGVYWVGLYSNYLMITTIINTLLNQIFTSITASVGNLNAEESREKSYNIFNVLYFLNFWICCICTVCLWVLFNPFITYWIGNQYTMNKYIVLMIVVNFYNQTMRYTVGMFKNTMGLFWKDRFKPIFESFINLVMSIILMKRFGIAGVFLGTFISTMATSFWVDPYILFKYGFKLKSSTFFKKYALYSFITITTAIVADFSTNNIVTHSLLNIFLRIIISLLIPQLVIIVLFFRTYEFKYLYAVGVKLIKNIKIKKIFN